MRFLIFVLPLVSAFVTHDGTLEHTGLKVDNSVKPCDDFYRHVCPDSLTDDDFLRSDMIQWLKEALQPYYPKALTNVVSAHAAESNRVRIGMSQAESRRELLNRCLTNHTTFRQYYHLFSLSDQFTNCVKASELLVERIHHSDHTENTKKDLTKRLGDLQSDVDRNSWFEYMGDEKSGFAEKEKRAKEVFVTIKDTMLELLLDSAWVKNRKLENKITNVMNQVRYSTSDGRPTDVTFEKIEKMYHKCTSEWITGHFNLEYDLCLLRAIDTLEQKKGAQLDKVKDQLVFSEQDGFYARIRNNRLVIMYPAMYGLLETQDEMRMLASFGYVLAHEVGHAMFVNGGDFAESESPEDIECLIEEMNKTCELFKKDWNCHSGIKTIREDAADLAALTTTLELAKKLMLNANTTSPTGALSPAKMFFYGIGILWCNEDKENMPWNDHSSGVVRVNGVLRQSEEFRRAFQCKSGDAMVMDESERCHLFGKIALR